MSKALFLLVIALVLLGFLMSTTMNMYDDLQQVRADNRRLAADLAQLQANYEAAIQERDALKAANSDYGSKLDQLQQAYDAEKQARVKAEADDGACRAFVSKLAGGPQPGASASAASPAQTPDPGQQLRSSVLPIGASVLATLLIVFVALAGLRHYRMNARRRVVVSASGHQGSW